MEQNQTRSSRTVFSFWPFLLWILPFAAVYGFGALGYQEVFGRTYNEAIAIPLLFVSAASFGLLARKHRNEFALALAVLSTGFFLREWHFTGTGTAVYVVATGVAGWFVVRRRRMSELIKNTPVEIWLWATGLCYLLSQMIARRMFGGDHLGWLPMEDTYHISLEETMETLAHIMLALTSFAAWRWFGAAGGVRRPCAEVREETVAPVGATSSNDAVRSD